VAFAPFFTADYIMKSIIFRVIYCTRCWKRQRNHLCCVTRLHCYKSQVLRALFVLHGNFLYMM